MGGMGIQTILPIQVSACINTILNFDCDFNGYGDVACKPIFSVWNVLVQLELKSCSPSLILLPRRDIHILVFTVNI